jgi:hypothetical protein
MWLRLLKYLEVPLTFRNLGTITIVAKSDKIYAKRILITTSRPMRHFLSTWGGRISGDMRFTSILRMLSEEKFFGIRRGLTETQ